MITFKNGRVHPASLPASHDSFVSRLCARAAWRVLARAAARTVFVLSRASVTCEVTGATFGDG
jgi:hypothetical protein